MTTADYARQSPCNEESDYAKKVRDGIIVDKEYLPCIYEADQSDDWKAESTWKKANPSYGITLPKSFFKAAVKKAIERPSEENTFKRLHLNIQTKTETRWIDLTAWNDSGDKELKPESLLGQPCYAGLDLSSSNDITAFVLYFPEKKACLPFFFVPKKTAENRAEFIVWGKSGIINITTGKVSHADIREFIIEKSKQYKILDIAYDSWNATQLAIQLADNDGLPMIEFRQGFFSMNEPSKVFETLVLNKELTHFDNPVLAWMVSNTNIKEDAAGNIKPIKPEKSSRLKIDGVVALVMAIGLSIGKEAKKHEDKNSVYNQRGLITL
jgi:phage terminase large subunit-like protein